MELLLAIGAFVLIGIVHFFMRRYHTNRIEEEIAYLGGTVLSSEYRFARIWVGPFKLVFRGQTVYYFRYEIDFDEKEGWVKFRPILGPDWRL